MTQVSQYIINCKAIPRSGEGRQAEEGGGEGEAKDRRGRAKEKGRVGRLYQCECPSLFEVHEAICFYID